MAGIDEMKKNAEKKPEVNVSATIAKKEKTISEKFIEELNPEEEEIFLKIKGIRTGTCELEEFEAVTEDSLDDYVKLITYIKEGKITFEDDGVRMKIRRPITNSKGDVITNSVKVLHKRNEDRERVFTKKSKFKKDNVNDSIDYSRCILAASLANENGVTLPPESIAPSKIHTIDYGLLILLQDFFRM